MLVNAYAKINISLDVTGKREDGYHLLKMVMQTIELHDSINIEKCREGINITCDKKFIPLDKNNLVYKAAELFMKTYNIKGGVNVSLKKNIPVAAGLAGGSTDAAAVLNGMRKMYEIKADDCELMKLGNMIGSDIPFCIKGGTAFCEGIGEIVTPLTPFENHILVLAKPPFGVSTKQVYKALDLSKIYIHPKTSEIVDAVKKNDLYGVCKNMKNVLENVVLKKYKIVSEFKKNMSRIGAVGVLMSGSGPTVYGFFDDMLKAQECFEYFKEKFSEVYITRTICP